MSTTASCRYSHRSTTTTTTARLRGPPVRGVGHNYEESSATTRSMVNGFFQRLGYLAPDPRRPTAGANSPKEVTLASRLLLLRAGDVERNPGPLLACGRCGRPTGQQALQCRSCRTAYHQQCSGVSRTEAGQQRQANSYRCPRCNPATTAGAVCRRCGKGFRSNQNKLTCASCKSLSHFGCTAITRMERERVKQGTKSWFCCHRSPADDAVSPTPTRNYQQTAAANTANKTTCANCNRTIKFNGPRATCTKCGNASYLACRLLTRPQQEEIRDGRRA